MQDLVKNKIKKLVKIQGTHLGAVKHQILREFEFIDFDLYLDFTKNEINKKNKRVESSIKSSIRYQ